MVVPVLKFNFCEELNFYGEITMQSTQVKEMTTEPLVPQNSVLRLLEKIVFSIVFTVLPGRFRHREVERFVKFATVGTIGMFIDLTILNLLHGVIGIPLLVANAVSFSSAVLNNFLLNRHWSFPESKERAIHTQLVQFAAVSITGLAINETILWQLAKFFHPLIGFPWDYNAAKVIAIAIVLFWNFSINRVWTYKGIK